MQLKLIGLGASLLGARSCLAVASWDVSCRATVPGLYQGSRTYNRMSGYILDHHLLRQKLGAATSGLIYRHVLSRRRSHICLGADMSSRRNNPDGTDLPSQHSVRTAERRDFDLGEDSEAGQPPFERRLAEMAHDESYRTVRESLRLCSSVPACRKCPMLPCCRRLAMEWKKDMGRLFREADDERRKARDGVGRTARV